MTLATDLYSYILQGTHVQIYFHQNNVDIQL
jgi:hypothetical protein